MNARTYGPTDRRALRGGDPVAIAGPHRATVDDAARAALETPSQPLDHGTGMQMQRRLGHDFGDVRVHVGPSAAAAAASIGANAYTVGRDVVFGEGRYDPASARGRTLIAHELAHVAHGAGASERRTGVAPAGSRAERMADAAAARSGNGDAVSTGSWGPAWTVHREVDKVAHRGTVQHTGDVGRLPGTDIPVGTVEVRTGEDIDLKNGARLPNMIALQYSGALAPDSRWLQFVWFEMTGQDPKGTAHFNGNLNISGTSKALTTTPDSPTWTIDTSVANNPFYEAGFANLRTNNATTMFDFPGGNSTLPLADAILQAGDGTTSATFTAHFETYLVQNNVAAYVVSWRASTVFTLVRGKTVAGAIGYTLGASGPVTALPQPRKALLDAGYPRFRGVT